MVPGCNSSFEQIASLTSVINPSVSGLDKRVRANTASGKTPRPGPGNAGQSLMASPLVPEFRLAAASAMWPPSDRRNQAIRAAASEPLDWARFLRVAGRHQVIGFVHEGLTRVWPDVPSEI